MKAPEIAKLLRDVADEHGVSGLFVVVVSSDDGENYETATRSALGAGDTKENWEAFLEHVTRNLAITKRKIKRKFK